MSGSGRQASVERKTKETEIALQLNLDGTGSSKVQTPIPFFSHMLEAWSKHGLMDLAVEATGDVEVDIHHTVEDVGIVLGQALKQALGDKKGIVRYGTSFVPMDEALCTTATTCTTSPRRCSSRSGAAWPRPRGSTRGSPASCPPPRGRCR
jgi:imidazoleglycerol-phosphate dehydratase